ncbi:MAG TPA: GNAT family N-acetyltransferase [Solirubrobacteraceae bacterium]|nr:GNAT family N-acetyltransferase [Solirubrobacteraceae bacterium]
MRYYAVAELDITDPGWVREYVAQVTPMVERRGGRYLARTAQIDKLEGERDPAQVFLIIEWPSKEAAEGFYESDEYRPYRESRKQGARNEFVLVAGDDVNELAHIDEPPRPAPAVRLEVNGTQAHVVLRPLAPGDDAELLRIHRAPEVVYWWDQPEDGFPWTDEPDTTRLVIEVDGAIAGLIQFWEEPAPNYPHAGIDLYLDPALHGRGIGTEAVRRVVRHLLDDRGHHRVTIDPATTNIAAIRAYEKVGFTRVGVMRRYGRAAGGEGWHDGLLMELLADD